MIHFGTLVAPSSFRLWYGLQTRQASEPGTEKEKEEEEEEEEEQQDETLVFLLAMASGAQNECGDGMLSRVRGDRGHVGCLRICQLYYSSWGLLSRWRKVSHQQYCQWPLLSSGDRV